MGDFEDKTGVYSGELKNGIPHGYGIKFYKSGLSYEGNWNNGAKHGRGEIKINGCSFDGEFIEGYMIDLYSQMPDEAIPQLLEMLNSSVNTVFNGEFYEEYPRIYFGKTELTFPKKNLIKIPKGFTSTTPTTIQINKEMNIEGIFDNGEPIGICKVYINGILEYEGEIKNGLYEGEGIIYNDQGIEYIGQFKRGKYEGKGTMIDDGTIITGDFKNGIPEGNVRMEMSDKIYEGSFHNSCPNGFGKLTTSNYTYEGEFLNTKFHGKGKKTCNSIIIEGTFKNGNIVNPCNVTVLGIGFYIGDYDEKLGFNGHGIIIDPNEFYSIEGDFNRMILNKKRAKIIFGEYSIEGKISEVSKWFQGFCRFTHFRLWIICISQHYNKFPYLTEASFLEYEKTLRTKNVSMFRKIKIPEGVYIGEICGENLHGKGRILFNNGEIYEGMLIMNKMHGQGSYFYYNHSVYTGGFVMNKKQGKGYLTLKDTSMYCGCWDDDFLEGVCIVKLNNQHVEIYFEKGKICGGIKLICKGFSAYGKIMT
ncbi:hypothetical protein SteCoe_10436 [Stentor coeruleus]|uniref:Uncharacterized protein n=1 Tax=Stentor coeruleus TaxID=5963 RepID=A0A1R2CFJ3_9CILI|nr:hypothetical protein SteCoe_10436 [Stentor coeruleus]